MSCGYACVNCGKCKGQVRPLRCEGVCPACGTANSADALVCAVCGMPVPPRPGRRFAAGSERASAKPAASGAWNGGEGD